MLSDLEFNRILAYIFNPANTKTIHRLQLALRQNELNFEQKRKLSEEVERKHSEIRTAHLVWLFAQTVKHFSYIGGTDVWGFATYFKDDPFQIKQDKNSLNLNNNQPFQEEKSDNLFEHGMIFEAKNKHSIWAKVECALHQLNKGKTNVGLQWLQEASNNNNEWAKTELAKYYLNNNKELQAYQLLLEITHNTDAMIYLGKMYQDKYPDRAIDCYYKAAMGHNHHGIGLLEKLAFNSNEQFSELAKMHMFVVYLLNQNMPVEITEKDILSTKFKAYLDLLLKELSNQLSAKNIEKEIIIQIINVLNKQAKATNNMEIISAIIKVLALSSNAFPDLIDDNSLTFKVTTTKLLMNDEGRKLLISMALEKLTNIHFDKDSIESLQQSFNMLEEVYLYFENHSTNELTAECVNFLKLYREKTTTLASETLEALKIGDISHQNKFNKLKSLKNSSKILNDGLMKCYEHETYRYLNAYKLEKKEAYLDAIFSYANEGCETAIKSKNILLEKEAITLHQEAIKGNKQSLTKLKNKSKEFATHQYYLGLYYEQKPTRGINDFFNSNLKKIFLKKAFSCYEAAAKMGNGAAYTKLGHYYKHGLGGVSIDVEKQLKYYYQAALNENSEGLIALKQMSHDETKPIIAIKANIYQAIRTNFNHFHYIESAFSINIEMTTKILLQFASDDKLNLHIRLQLLQSAYKDEVSNELQPQIKLTFTNLLINHLKTYFSQLTLLNKELHLLGNYINPLYFAKIAVILFNDFTLDLKIRTLIMCTAEYFIDSARINHDREELKYFDEIMINLKNQQNFENIKAELTFIPSAPVDNNTTPSAPPVENDASTDISIPLCLSALGVTIKDIEEIELDQNTSPEYLDIITSDLLLDPVIMNDGHSYNRETAIGLVGKQSPINQSIKLLDNYHPNNKLKGDVIAYVEKYKKQCTATTCMNKDNNNLNNGASNKSSAVNSNHLFDQPLNDKDTVIKNNSLYRSFKKS